MAELLEGETDSFEATQTVDFGEGPKVFEAWSITDGETAKAYLKSYVAIYRRQAAERQCIQAGSVENWYSSMTPELSQEWADMKKSLLGWEKQAKEQEDYWKRVKQMEQPAAPLAPVTPPVTEAQRIADVQKAIDSDRQRTARLTGIML